MPNDRNTKAPIGTNACRKRAADDSQPCSITMPRGLQEALIRRAKMEDRSFSATVRRAVEHYLGKTA